jgi:hypothetical protein
MKVGIKPGARSTMRTIESTQMVPSPRRTIEQMIQSGRLSRDEYLQLTSRLLADQHLNDRDRHQINRALEYVQSGRLRLDKLNQQ